MSESSPLKTPIRQLANVRVLLAAGMVLVELMACSPLTATPPPFSREQAIARASQDARQSVPEVGIQRAQIDSVTAELITLAEADQRIGGTRGPGGYIPGQTPQSPVWWVVVRGYFQYEGLGAPPNLAPNCEADERDFIFDARTGESVGESVPNTRCPPSQLPFATATIALGIFVQALPAPAISLAIDPRAPNVVYALLVNDALYRSNDRGQKWQRLAFPAAERPFELPLDPQNRNAIFMLPPQDVRFARAEPARLFVRAGQALYCSDDAGTTWRPLPVAGAVYRVAIAPGEPSQLYLWTQHGFAAMTSSP